MYTILGDFHMFHASSFIEIAYILNYIDFTGTDFAIIESMAFYLPGELMTTEQRDYSRAFAHWVGNKEWHLELQAAFSQQMCFDNQGEW